MLERKRKTILKIICLIIVALNAGGCSYIVINDVELSLEPPIRIKIIGDSDHTEINYCILDKEDEEKFKEEHPTRAINELIEYVWKDKTITSSLPWTKTLDIDHDEILYLQVKPLDFKDPIDLPPFIVPLSNRVFQD